MCIAIEYTNYTGLTINNENITGSCKGPILRIVNNPKLEFLSLSRKLVKNWKSEPNAIRVRGNRKLSESDLKRLKKTNNKSGYNWDLQEIGECAIPKPFLSFKQLEPTCVSFYGPLTVGPEAKAVPHKPSDVHEFNFTGCIQVENTKLKDVTFLLAFSKFKLVPFCPQYIRNNKNLCPKNLKYLNVIFTNIKIENNLGDPCSECIGGQVSEQYLSESAGCSFVYGDLIIANWKGWHNAILAIPCKIFFNITLKICHFL
ncbi:hypothetical protein ANCCAN_23884 [Ancylostoma caninum]|uniref:Receptor L domain protein n=1 Tax=Ancylostoma caninum TaxID=29170 RepID=A0A368FDX5_ANCCA|nr:hypothetical protein ANCCAN_23884 [Ancylostoma caninum]